MGHWDEHDFEFRTGDYPFSGRRSRPEEPPEEITFDEVKAETELAVLLAVGDEDHWIPISQIRKCGAAPPKVGAKAGTVLVPHWLAKAKGLI